MESKIVRARVDSVQPLTDTILQVRLSPETFVDYQAGQYLQVLCGAEPLHYSIANAPLGSHTYELHIRHSRSNNVNQALLHTIKKEGQLTLRLPLGVCTLERLDAHKPILFIAAGTGFAPLNAMIEQLLADADPRPFALYWQARSQSDLYLDAKVRNWQQHVAAFRYYSVLSDNTQNTLKTHIAQQEAQARDRLQTVIAGPFDFVYNLCDALVKLGFDSDAIFSDALDFKQQKGA